ncbi:sensor histidine kinase [Shewanella sairae]|nr:HAMP domain-containing sensor histidine kinase [Shewanella sairae]MCL1132412.1 HAMP domain-containing histidine kinase [Shewanella sairae]
MMRSIFARLSKSHYFPNWLKTSAIQQGGMLIITSCVSIILMSSITISYVDYHLDELNDEIEQKIEAFMKGEASEIDDDPIDEDDVITILEAGFTLSGLLVLILSTAVIIYTTRMNQSQIEGIEKVLHDAAAGNLSARTNESIMENDLSRIGYAIDEMLSQLQGAVASMNDISANIAHELKTPITRLQHNLQSLKETGNYQELQKDELNIRLSQAINESARLATIFDALLRISQIESGHRRQRFASLNITSVLATIADIYTDVAEDAGLSLQVHNSNVPIYLLGDQELLIQALANLIENALRYCPEGSQINLSCQAFESELIITVEDNGQGISDSEKTRVFERLYRGNKARNDEGLGLGLSLVKAVTELHHGHISLFDCHPGLGIKITLPLRG